MAGGADVIDVELATERRNRLQRIDDEIHVRDAIDAHRRGFDDNPVEYLHQNQGRLEADVLRAASAYLGATPGDIALTDSTTMGLGLLYNGLDVRPDQDLLTTSHDFYATHEALRLKADRSGATLRLARLYAAPASASQDEIVGSLAARYGTSCAPAGPDSCL